MHRLSTWELHDAPDSKLTDRNSNTQKVKIKATTHEKDNLLPEYCWAIKEAEHI